MSNEQNIRKMENVKNFTSTIEMITELTMTFRNEYMAIMESWVESEFMRKVEDLKKYEDASKNGKLDRSYDSMVWQKRVRSYASEIYTFNWYQLRINSEIGLEEYNKAKMSELKSTWCSKEMKKINKSFDASVEKIAFKFDQKGMNIENMEVVNAYMHNGLDLTLTDGEKKVHAFTIIAWGEIQKPHFRFLIK